MTCITNTRLHQNEIRMAIPGIWMKGDQKQLDLRIINEIHFEPNFFFPPNFSV